MVPPQAIPILCQMEHTSIQVSWWVPYLPKGCRPDFNNGLVGDSNSGPVLAPGVYLSPTRIMAPPRATPILCQMKYTSVQVSYLSYFGLGNDFNSDVSKQIRHYWVCTNETFLWCYQLGHVDVLGVISLDILRWLGQLTIRLKTLEHVNGRKFTEKKRRKRKRIK